MQAPSARLFMAVPKLYGGVGGGVEVVRNNKYLINTWTSIECVAEEEPAAPSSMPDRR